MYNTIDMFTLNLEGLLADLPRDNLEENEEWECSHLIAQHPELVKWVRENGYAALNDDNNEIEVSPQVNNLLTKYSFLFSSNKLLLFYSPITSFSNHLKIYSFFCFVGVNSDLTVFHTLLDLLNELGT